MSLIDENNGLPGVYTEVISQYSEGFDTTQWGSTEAVVIMGTAFDGPVNRPVKIYSPEHAKYVFGSVYNSKTKQEATLVANIQDAYDRGCRSIYGVRISGKSIFKDYQLAVDTDLKLRVAGQFPSNENKNIYMLFDADTDEIKINIYKPANKATMKEKASGRVESQDSVIVNTIDLYNGGLTKDDDLVDLINRVNGFQYNNAIVLTIVDKDGNDVTLSSEEVKRLKIGDMFPGIYTIGRSSNVEGVLADTKLELVLEGKPYDSFEGQMFKRLVRNTNVSKDLPIYSKEKDLHKLIGISALDQYSFLQVPGKIDDYFRQDKVDYEEVNLTDFDIYKKLGSGFAINSKLVEKGAHTGKFKVVEITDSKTRKSPINDGVYSMLENLPARYRVLTGVSAGIPIKGKLPSVDKFKFANSVSTSMLGDRITVVSKTSAKDLTEPKKYTITFEELSAADKGDIEAVSKGKIFSGKTIEAVNVITMDGMKNAIKDKKKFAEGSKFLVTGCQESEECNLLYSFINGKFVCQHQFVSESRPGDALIKDEIIYAGGKFLTATKVVKLPDDSSQMTYAFVDAAPSVFDGNDYAIVTLANGTFVLVKIAVASTTSAPKEGGEAVISSTAVNGKIIGTAAEILSDKDNNDDNIYITISSNYNETNEIKIKSEAYDYLTIDDVVDILNADKDFAKLFKISTVSVTSAQDFISDIKDEAGVTLTADMDDKVISYDTNLHIPFRTDDTFERQLAQHCTYTSLKTSPTHGFIGTKILLDRSLDSIESMINNLISMGIDGKLVAKKGNGTDILDKDNMPYQIGRKVSILVGQYKMTIDNYTFISNMAAGYAGMVSTLPLDQSSTCQAINCPTPMYEFTNYQLGLLTGAGFVTLKRSYANDNYVITDGVTMAQSGSPYRRLSASRIADAIEDLIRVVCEPYIGKQNNLNNQNSLRTAIKSKLDTIKNTLLESYKFSISTNESQMQLGEIFIDYEVVPIYEIKSISNRITVKQS